jgi:hypothetical protein
MGTVRKMVLQNTRGRARPLLAIPGRTLRKSREERVKGRNMGTGAVILMFGWIRSGWRRLHS